jgi:Protein of unknown function (DUF2865)
MRGCVMRTRFMDRRGLGRRVVFCAHRSYGAALTRYAATLAVVIAAFGYGGGVVWDAVLGVPSLQSLQGEGAPAAETGPLRTAAVVLESDDWTQSIRTEKFWTSRKTGAVEAKPEFRQPDFRQRSGLINTSSPVAAPSPVRTPITQPVERSAKNQPKTERTDGSDWYEGDGGNFRTVCVRLCDGYFWPISFSTDDSQFDRDKKTCEKSCSGTPTRLFTHENPGQDVEQMVDLKGLPYSKLRTAYLFRTAYDESCKCNAHPWEQESRDRHRVYALEAEKRKGSKLAAAELAQMKAALIAARKSTTTGVKSSGLATGSLQARDPATAVTVVAAHAPLSSPLLSSPLPTSLAVPPVATVQSERLVQVAQMVPQASPVPAARMTISDQNAAPPSLLQMIAQPALMPVPAEASQFPVIPAAPFALPLVAPAIPVMPVSPVNVSPVNVSPVTVSSLAPTASPAGSLPPAVAASSALPVQSQGKLAVVAPPIISAGNSELGLSAPPPINTAQLKQINPSQKPAVRKTEPPTEPKTMTAEDKPRQRTEPRVAAEPPPKPRRERVVEREPERREPEPKPERRIVARPTPAPAPRVVERPTPRPARVVEAPRPAQSAARPRPQQVMAVRDNWRQRVFESR